MYTSIGAPSQITAVPCNSSAALGMGPVAPGFCDTAPQRFDCHRKHAHLSMLPTEASARGSLSLGGRVMIRPCRAAASRRVRRRYIAFVTKGGRKWLPQIALTLSKRSFLS